MIGARRGLPFCTALVAALLLTGCGSSKWRFGVEGPGGRATTKAHVISEPPGADITLNGRPLQKAPFYVPVKYPYKTAVYHRRISFPYPHSEEKEVKRYVENVFTFEAFKVGYYPAKVTLKFVGEEE
ncbi:MAG: hypothetical protein ACYTDY_15110, partial [Planctomycetota bacterium]